MGDRKWAHAPGECVDSKGVPIYPGDLLRSLHFRDRRGRRHWMYHVIVAEAVPGHDGPVLKMVPTSHLEPTMAGGGGSCLLAPELASVAEVISGHGPGEVLDYRDRDRS